MSSVLGIRWSMNYAQRLGFDSGANLIWAYRPDGKALKHVLTNGAYVPDADITDRLYADGTNGVAYRLHLSDGSVERYDDTGRLLSLADSGGKLRTLVYSDGNAGYVLDASGNPTTTTLPAGRLIQVTDDVGRSLQFGTDAAGRVVKIAIPEGGVIHYRYDVANNLSTVTYPDGKTKTYHYEDSRFPHALTGITDENGVRYITYTYDSTGRAVGEVMAGNVESYGLNFGSNQTTVTDPLGTQRTYAFQTILGVAKSTGVSQPGGSGCGPASSALTYDGNGNVATRKDFNGNQTTYTYDLSRNLETKRVEASGKPESRTISTQWHSYWRQPVKLAEPNKLTTWVFNGDGGAYCAPQTATVPSINGGTQPIGVVCSRTEQATTDASGSTGFAATVTGTPRTWRYTYDTYGQVLTADGPRTDVADVTTTTYYAATDPDMGKRGNLATITNALGQVTQITAYDLHGNPLTIVDPNGMQTTLTYDLRQRLTSRTVGGETTTYTYDGVGQLLKVTLPDGSHTTYTYDPAHRLTGIADALGNSITYTLDAIGNRTKEEVKDPAGQLARTRSRIYDALSRLAQDIGAQGQATRYEYDANGNRTKTTDPLNQVTVSNYDALNRLIQVTDPGLGQTRYGWDGQDRLTRVTDPRNLVTTYTLDGLGNPSALQSPDTGSTTSTFDAAGNEVTRTDAKGQTTITRYDALNRPTRITYADGSATHYQWDQGNNGIGRLGTIEEYDGNGNRLRSIVLNHDPQGRLTGETRTLGNVAHSIAYGYSSGQLVRLTLPSAKQLTYTRNAAGQITQVALTANGQSKTLLQNIAYHPFGGVKHFTDGAGQLHSRSHDQDGRTSSYTLGGQTWLLSYDAASRITGLIDGGQAANSATYGYDALDRLTGASLPATAYAYAYDANGNRTAHTAGSTTRAYTTAATSNRLQSLNNPVRSLSHDANGSRTVDGSQQYAYDVRGRLSQSITAAGTTHYQVNALGQRVGKRNGTSETLYHYDQAGRLLAESDAAGNLQREYVWLDDIPVAVLQ